ncbi:hypothetical protein [Roseococcus sp. YIM B11640]|uniref:hypothetical protein n=1 Tax=Roseococcus sp. YIM B11640 TaxID=3133973 RepID=UPI003C7D52D7
MRNLAIAVLGLSVVASPSHAQSTGNGPTITVTSEIAGPIRAQFQRGMNTPWTRWSDDVVAHRSTSYQVTGRLAPVSVRVVYVGQGEWRILCQANAPAGQSATLTVRGHPTAATCEMN